MAGGRRGIRDVAKRAGVSTATVSRTLSTPDRVTAPTRDRVLAAISDLGYTPNAAAQNLRGRRAMTVLIVVPRLNNPFMASLVRELNNAFTAQGYGVIVADLARDEPDRNAKARRLIEFVWSGKIDGVISMLGHVPAYDGRSLEDTMVPLLGLCVPLQSTRWPSLMTDDRVAAHDATRRLIALGHRELVYLGGRDDNANEQARYEGFRTAIEEGDARATRIAGRFSLESGAEQARAFLDGGTTATGIVASADENAIAFMSVMRNAGYEVPQDLSVIGFDGLELSRYVWPSLATMVQPTDDLARRGVDMLVGMMRDGAPSEGGAVHMVPAAFRDGGSLAPPSFATA